MVQDKGLESHFVVEFVDLEEMEELVGKHLVEALALLLNMNASSLAVSGR